MDFLAWSIDMSLVLLVFIMLIAGVAIGWLLNSYLHFVRRREQHKSSTDHVRAVAGETAKSPGKPEDIEQ